MAVIASVNVTQTGDIGGAGVSRWWFENAAHTVPSSADCVAASVAIRAFYNTIKGYLPGSMTYAFPSVCGSWDVGTGAPQAEVPVSGIPAVVNGTGGHNYPAGVGARLNIQTGVVVGRRYLRGNIMLVPLDGACYDVPTGAVDATVAAGIVAAWVTCAAALVTANLTQEIWHRPKNDAGGVAYEAIAATIGPQPAGVRSRRN
jgi:hypothetical protein